MKLQIRYLFNILLITLFSCTLTIQVEAQQINATNLSSTRVDQMNDQQILQIWQQAQRSGMSEADAMSLLVKRGMPATEVNSLKKRLVMMQSKSKSGSNQSLIRDTANFLNDSSWVKSNEILQ